MASSAESSSGANRVREWFKENYDENITGIEDFVETENGVEIHLREQIDEDTFKEAMTQHGHEVENIEIDGDEGMLTTSSTELATGGEVGGKFGSIFKMTHGVTISGNTPLIWENLEPAGDEIKQTLDQLVWYLEERY